MRPTARLGLVTTGSRQNATEILDYFGCRDWFEVILTSEDVVHNKPDPGGVSPGHGAFGRSAGDYHDL